MQAAAEAEPLALLSSPQAKHPLGRKHQQIFHRVIPQIQMAHQTSALTL